MGCVIPPTSFNNSALNNSEMLQKRCTKCGVVKSFNEFYKHKIHKDGLRPECKICAKKSFADYYKTKKGVITQIYNTQKLSSKHRNHKMPKYTSHEFSDFCFASPDFHKLYDIWAVSGYNRWLKPSFDRKDDYKGYSFDNFNRWMPFKENNKKGHSDTRNGINNKHSKAVIGVRKTTGEVFEFYSACEAGRQIGIDRKGISKCCLGELKSSGGFRWEFKNK